MSTTPLPAEIWLRVLQNLQKEDDLLDLWTSYRQVCTTFKQAVETVFCEKHLRKTFIRFQLGDYFNDESQGITIVSEFEFSHLSEDKTRATFKLADETADEYKPEIREHLRSATRNNLESSNYVIQIHRAVNDGPIPDVSVDYENLQLTCDWREMYTIFFAEELMYHKFLQNWVKGQESWAFELREKMERGELDMMEMMQKALGSFGSGDEEAREVARRNRIKAEYLRLDGTKWNADHDGDVKEEKKALKKVKEIRYYASMEEHSDDEDEDLDEEGDEEEDEWEDEDDDGGSEVSTD